MEDRYIMMVDENGQPFICHAGMFQKAGNAIKSAGTAAANAVRNVSRGRGTRQNHKYLMKVGAPEKPRYLYTQEEVRAYLQGGRRALNNAVDKAGQTAKNAVNTAKNTAKKTVETTKGVANKLKESTGIPAKRRLEESKAAYDKADKEWNKAYETALSTSQSRSNLQWEKNENGEWRKRELNDEQQKRLNAAKAAEKRAGDKLDDATKKSADAADAYRKDYAAYKDSPMEKVDNAVNTAKNAANKVVDVVKDKAGVDERKRAEEAWDKVPRRVSSDDKEAVEAFRKATEAQKEYRKTPLGAAEYAKERAYEIATGQDGTAKEIAEKVAGKAKEKATEAVDNAKSKYDRMRDEFKEKTGINAKRELEKAERDSYEAAKAYKQTERVERENGNDGTNLEALRNLNDKNNAEDYAKYLYERTPLGKAEKFLKGESNTERHTSHEKTVEKANADMDRHDLEIAAKRGPIDLDHVSKEYMFALGSNTGHGSEVKKAIEANDAYTIARRKYDSLAKDKNAPSTSVLLAKKQMEVAKKEYDKRMGTLSDVLNNDVEEAKKELSKSK